MLNQRRRWADVYKCHTHVLCLLVPFRGNSTFNSIEVPNAVIPDHRSSNPMLALCWADVAHGDPTLSQQWLIALVFAGMLI